MRLTIRRVGGQLPTFQPARVMTDGDLDAATAEIARSFVRAPPAGGSAPQPDSFRVSWNTLKTLQDLQDRYQLQPDPTAEARRSLFGVPVSLSSQISITDTAGSNSDTSSCWSI